MLQSPRLTLVLAIVGAMLAGCAAPGTVGSTPTPTGIPTQSPAPQRSPAPSDDPATSPAPQASPTPNVTPSPTLDAVAWSAPRLIRPGDCSRPSATIDSSGRRHVVTACDGGVRYLTSADGSSWAEMSIVPEIDVLEMNPQVAVDGDTVHVVYDRLVPEDGGCGGDGLSELGVFLSSRRLPNGAWSDPVRIGNEGDRLQAFRAARGVLHLTVSTSPEGSVVYESRSGSTLTRIAIPDALATSLRVGDDGKARIAFSTGQAVRYATVQSGTLSSVTVAESADAYLRNPLLVLGPGNDGYIVWTRKIDPGGGCVERDPGPLDGTWFATDTSGAWATTRVTPSFGETSLTLDPTSGRIHVLVVEFPMTHYTSTDGSSWDAFAFTNGKDFVTPTIRIDPTTGALVVFALQFGQGVVVFGST